MRAHEPRDPPPVPQDVSSEHLSIDLGGVGDGDQLEGCDTRAVSATTRVNVLTTAVGTYSRTIIGESG
jgi:hypothetical protein